MIISQEVYSCPGIALLVPFHMAGIFFRKLGTGQLYPTTLFSCQVHCFVSSHTLGCTSHVTRGGATVIDLLLHFHQNLVVLAPILYQLFFLFFSSSYTSFQMKKNKNNKKVKAMKDFHSMVLNRFTILIMEQLVGELQIQIWRVTESVTKAERRKENIRK